MQNLRTSVVALSLCVALSACAEDPMDPPHYGVFSVISIVGEALGYFMPTDTTASRIGVMRTMVAGPALKPDFMDRPAPPFCMAFKFGATTPPNVVNADAGAINITGFGAASFLDLTQGPPSGNPTAFPTVLSCDRQSMGSTLPYACNAPSTVMLFPESGSWLGDTTKLTVAASGGENAGAFTMTVPTAAAVHPTPAMGLYAVPRTEATIAWDETTASMVMIEIIGQLQDGSAGAQILCLEPAASRSKAIPAQAMALLPEPTATAPLFIQTHLLGIDLGVQDLGWGNTMIAAGRGEFGLTCWTPSGPCPQ